MTPEQRILVIEDDPDVLLGCEQALQLEGLTTEGVGSVEAALKSLAGGLPAVIVTDVRLPGRDGLWLLNEVRAMDPELPVVLITGHGDVAMAVQAMQAGAYDFIEKPFRPDYLVEVVKRGAEKRALSQEVRALRARLADGHGLETRILGEAPAMARLRQTVTDLADTSASVLIEGETGTGKELVARCLHDLSNRRRGHFVAINCGGLPESLVESELFGHEAGAFTGAAKRRIGKIEHASGGTLFLDEIESMPMAVQIKLLRVLQERVLERLGSNTPVPVNCRIIAAVKGDLLALSEQGRFRADLYYRLNVATLTLPPLRERRADIPLLFAHFCEEQAIAHGRPVPEIGPDRMQRLIAYGWPGNVRELANVAGRLVLGIEKGFAPFADRTSAEAGEGLSLAQSVDAYERALIVDALARTEGHLGRAAQRLQIAKSTLYDKMVRHGLAGG